MARVLIETYGCTLNQADSEIMGSMLKQSGHNVEYGRYDENNHYDYVIMNTCTVKSSTEQKELHRISKASKLGSKLIVAGCLASANKDRILSAAPSSSIITTSNISKINDAITDISSGKRVDYGTYFRDDKLQYLNPPTSVIAKIPVSEGCLSSCSFCETKFARGPLNSFSEDLIIKAIEMSVSKGAKEIELTSQDTGAYGIDRGTNIAELANRASELEGSFKIRIGMLNPEHLHRYFDNLLESYSSDKVYKFAHLPVQSGSNKVLKEMSRNYTIEEFAQYVKELRSKIKGIQIMTDIIVGYPTEMQSDYEESLGMIEQLRPNITNVSKFSMREHARASRLKQLDNNTIKSRSREMSRVVRAIEVGELKKLVGRRERVLITEKNKTPLGRDDCYRQVAMHNEDVNLGQEVDVIITGATITCLVAEAVG